MNLKFLACRVLVNRKPGFREPKRFVLLLLSSLVAFSAVALIALFPSWGLSAVRAAGGDIIYVDKEAVGAATGLSWTDAFTNVQDALGTAVAGDEIWVANSIYYPDEGGGQTNNDINTSFQLVTGVGLYGGFAATETVRSQRDWQTNITVLSGDIDGNDQTDPNGVVTSTANITGSNSYHVITASVNAATTLDGFFITAAKTTFSAPEFGGGGMFNQNGSPLLANLTFMGNESIHGAGLYNLNASPTVTNVSFIANKAQTRGGAVANEENSSPNITNVLIKSNFAYLGGGIYNDGNSHAKITNAYISGNTSFIVGGGMASFFSNPVLTNVLFTGNTSTFGGGMMLSSGNPTLINVTVSGNLASDDGGGILNGDTNTVVYNSIFWNNQDSSGTGTITASITNQFSSISLTHSLVQGSGGSSSWIAGPTYLDGGGNIDEDPLFVTPLDPSTAPTTAGNVRLQYVSPAVDAGDNDFITVTLDLDGQPRIVDGDGDSTAVVDMGPFELPSLAGLIVNLAGNGTGTVTSQPSGINCAPTCSAGFVYSTVVTLTAVPQGNHIFLGWSGACSGTADCVLVMTQTHQVTATFFRDEFLNFLPAIRKP